MRITCQRKLLIWATLSLLFVFMSGKKTYATTETKLPNPGALGGNSVSINGDMALVGDYHDASCGTDSGAAHVFRRHGSIWVHEQKLVSSDCEALDKFGYSVSISGNVALVGARGDADKGDRSGSVYVFRWNGFNYWVQEQKLVASDGEAFDLFGESVSISGDVALVGAFGDDDNGLSSGSAYVFRWNGSSWVEEQKLLASDGAVEDSFGESVSISGDVALIGAWRDEDNGSMSGSAYVFRYNGSNWVQEQKLLASDGQAIDEFGLSVSISGGVALVGAEGDDDNGDIAGSAYVFRWNGSSWVEEQKLLASDGAKDDMFGHSVSINGDMALVGAYGDDDNGSKSGSAYVFRWTGSIWVEKEKLLASDGNVDYMFGHSVSVSGGLALVGADGSGSAYVYTVVGDGFYAIPTSGPIGPAFLTVNFTDLSTGDITAWFWDFDDGEWSTEQNPSHTYDEVGNYTISLIVNGPEGSNTMTRANYISVYSIDSIENLVTEYYTNILDRSPDAAERDAWVDEIERIVSLGIDVKEGFIALAKFFFNSAEYVQQAKPDSAYVTDLYQTFFQRIPDQSEVAYWTGLLSEGLARNVVLNYFVFSEEFRLFMEGIFGPSSVLPENNLVNDFYRGFPNRLPDSVGFNNWVALMLDAQCTGAEQVRNLSYQIALGFIGSPEYILRNRSDSEYVEDLYNGILRRGALPDEFAYWINFMAQGNTRQDTLTFFTDSAEFQVRVQEVIDAGCKQ